MLDLGGAVLCLLDKVSDELLVPEAHWEKRDRGQDRESVKLNDAWETWEFVLTEL